MPDLGLPTIIIGLVSGFLRDLYRIRSINLPAQTKILRKRINIPVKSGDTQALKFFPRIMYNLEILLRVIILIIVYLLDPLKKYLTI